MCIKDNIHVVHYYKPTYMPTYNVNTVPYYFKLYVKGNNFYLQARFDMKNNPMHDGHKFDELNPHFSSPDGSFYM